MKKIGFIFLSILLSVSLFMSFPFNADAKTIKQLESELAALKKKKSSTETEKKKTQAEINSIKSQMASAAKEIEQCDKDIAQAEEDIIELGKEIENKKAQIKELVAFLQLSNSEDFYLNYIFGSESYEDFIYRCSVVEQLTQRNDELVDEMNELIAQNKAKIIAKEKRQKELDALNAKLQKMAVSLGSELKDIVEESVSIDDEIKSMNELIAYYKKQGCSDTQDVSTCSNLPYDYGFNKPLKSGRITSEFGYRLHPIYKTYKLHTGTDIGGNSEGTPIYASATGRVVMIIKKSSCGGNQVYLNHNISGTPYTTFYMHLLNYNVKVGDIVTKGQKIGTVGGGRSTTWDGCSTGAHLHFGMAKGHYMGDSSSSYRSYSTFVSRLVNPRSLIYFPNRW